MVAGVLASAGTDRRCGRISRRPSMSITNLGRERNGDQRVWMQLLSPFELQS